MAWKSLGKITVSSAGTPVQSTTSHIGCQCIRVFASTTNTGANVYAGVASNFSKGNTNCIGIIPKGTFQDFYIRGASDGMDAQQIWIDVDTSADTALVSYSEG